ncbi:MAG: Glyoxalase/bleomycin resistance protein/dioxygenase [Sphingomonas bacterium]|nr:Glyoxalase/bleomycin resistance protein/dioxygenase [Sphingomonas bacterium]
MIGYALLGSNDMDRARNFYDALFGTIGVGRLMEFPTGATAWGQAGRHRCSASRRLIMARRRPPVTAR